MHSDPQDLAIEISLGIDPSLVRADFSRPFELILPAANSFPSDQFGFLDMLVCRFQGISKLLTRIIVFFQSIKPPIFWLSVDMLGSLTNLDI
jgi:hypothetical protein